MWDWLLILNVFFIDQFEGTFSYNFENDLNIQRIHDRVVGAIEIKS